MSHHYSHEHHEHAHEYHDHIPQNKKFVTSVLSSLQAL